MKKLFSFLAFIILTQPLAVAAESVSVGDLTISKAWSRASAAANRPGGAFLSITNNGSASERLVAAETPVAAKAELHNHITENGVMKMRHVMAIDIPPTGVTMLKPGGFHIMLFNLNSMLKEGGMFPLTLTFEKAGKATVMVHVGKAGARAAMDHSAKHMNSAEHQEHMKDNEHRKMHEEHMKDDGHKKMHKEHMKSQ